MYSYVPLRNSTVDASKQNKRKSYRLVLDVDQFSRVKRVNRPMSKINGKMKPLIDYQLAVASTKIDVKRYTCNFPARGDKDFTKVIRANYPVSLLKNLGFNICEANRPNWIIIYAYHFTPTSILILRANALRLFFQQIPSSQRNTIYIIPYRRFFGFNSEHFWFQQTKTK